MNEKYKKVRIVCILDIICMFLLDQMNIQIHSQIVHAIGVLIMSVPFCILLNLIEKDEQIAIHYRILAKIVLRFWIFCYVMTVIGKVITFIV